MSEPPIVDPKQRFSATVDDYHRYRPSYPAGFVDWLLQLAQVRRGAVVLDLGCGTGITTRLFSERGLRVVGTDPNAQMLARAAISAPGEWIQCTSDALGVRDHCAQLAIAGQAFHWFDVPKTRAELDRVLAPDGWACAFWNRRVNVGLHAELEQLLCELSQDYVRLRGKLGTVDEIRTDLGARVLHEGIFASEHELSRDEFMGRVRSSSYVVHGIEDKAEFERRLNASFDQHASAGRVRVRYETLGFAWKSVAVN